MFSVMCLKCSGMDVADLRRRTGFGHYRWWCSWICCRYQSWPRGHESTVCFIRPSSAQSNNGLQVTCIEKRGTLGGTCLNVGCIPSKALLNNSHLYHQILHDTKNRGIEVGDVKLNLETMMKAKDTSVAGLTKGVEFLFKKNNVEYIKGTAAFSGEHELKVSLTEGGEQ